MIAASTVSRPPLLTHHRPKATPPACPFLPIAPNERERGYIRLYALEGIITVSRFPRACSGSAPFLRRLWRGAFSRRREVWALRQVIVALWVQSRLATYPAAIAGIVEEVSTFAFAKKVYLSPLPIGFQADCFGVCVWQH